MPMATPCQAQCTLKQKLPSLTSRHRNKAIGHNVIKNKTIGEKVGTQRRGLREGPRDVEFARFPLVESQAGCICLSAQWEELWNILMNHSFSKNIS